MTPIKFILKWGFFFLICGAIFATLALFYYFQGLPTLSDLEKEAGKRLIKINYTNDNLLANRGEIYASKVNYYELPQNLINAVVAIEDRRFFSHIGIDFFGTARAFYANRKAGRIVQGGSTVTQQLAKMLFLSSKKTAKRKIQEALLALQLERHFTKEQIITFYLNRAYFGSGNYGIAEAAKYYFAKDVAQLNLKECAMLAGILKSPAKYSPKNNRQKAEERAEIVMKSMIDAGFLNEKNLSEFDHDPSYNSYRSQRLYFADFVNEQYGEFLSKADSNEQSIIIKSTLDEHFQRQLEEILAEFIDDNLPKLGKSQIAIIAMEKDGAIIAMSGGNDYQKSQYNRAIYAKRQSGSAFKTFVYLAALQNGLKIDDVFEDKKINIGTWLPENYEKQYLGKVSVKEAFAKSSNSVAIQIAKQVGSAAIIKTASDLGIVAKIAKNDPTIALGTSEVSLLELTSAYATIANDGVAVIPYAIRKIENDVGKILYQRQSSGLEAVVLPENLADIKELLRGVIEKGTGKNANVDNDIYGKTGTSQNFRDAWFIGFNNKYVIGIWIGNDDNSPTNKIAGGLLPAKLFAKIIDAN